MKTLYLLRHANAAQATPPQMSDYDRTLSAQGVRDARSVGRFMQSNRMQPDFVLSSAAIRTAETAQIIMNVLFGKIDAANVSHFDKDLYQAPDEKLLSEIRKTDPSRRSLMLVAHNPGVAELAYMLGKVNRYEPGTLSVFRAQCRDWNEFSAETVRLEKIFVPEG